MKTLIIDGHPDASPERFCHALTEAYQKGAVTAGHEVKIIKISELDIPCLRSEAESVSGSLPNDDLRKAQESITWANHIVIIYPLWLGDMPAYLKAFLEHVLSPGFAFNEEGDGKLDGKSASIIVTMAMPALFYSWFYFSHSLINLKRNILQFVGIKSVNETLIGSIKTADHKKWLKKVEQLGNLGI